VTTTFQGTITAAAGEAGTQCVVKNPKKTLGGGGGGGQGAGRSRWGWGARGAL